MNALINSLIYGIFVLLIVFGIVAYLTWIERKFAGRMQSRIGPYYVGRPHGWLQPLADVLKLILKEDITPKNVDKLIYNLAPFVVLISATLLYAVLPFSENIVISDISVGILTFIAISSLSIMGAFMAGWASNSKYPLISAIRGGAQIVSYEIPLLFSIIVPCALAGSLNAKEIVKAQKIWFILYPVIGQISFIIFLLSGLAEENRTPFDIPEAESELVAGFTVEYSSMKFALFYAAEYAHILALSALGTILFLGGWKGPLLPSPLWFLIKSLFLFLILLWIRWSYLRVRIDQLLGFSWKFLFPLSVLNLLLTGLVIILRKGG
ncbi:MAG: NADH-quinone oxidoreductase subunit NuoH [candidate division WOR-3 bacterium]|uniref:NADH-quinone oxidoreductase subunit H n=3 Tax=candidate division WOR-3 bacterium TaxID=2052148 RepID=A0A7V3ZSY8_UNCW3